MTLCGEGSSASSTHEELWRAEKPFLRVRELKRPEGSGMLINYPLSEGSKASSTNQGEHSITELWGVENSFLRNEKELRRSEGSGMLINDPLDEGGTLALPTASSGERRTHSSDERKLRFSEGSGMPIGDPLRWGEQCWLDQRSHEEVRLIRTYRIPRDLQTRITWRPRRFHRNLRGDLGSGPSVRQFDEHRTWPKSS